MLIIVMGLPGSGKTYFAKAFASKFGALHTNSDTIRKELYHKPNYHPEDKAIVYRALFDFVTKGLKEGKDVVIDATFSRQTYRQPYFDFADQHHIPCFVILMEADEAIIKERVQKKRPDSDADFAIYLKIKAEYEKLDKEHLLLRSDTIPLSEMLVKANQYIKKKNQNSLTDSTILQLIEHGKFPDGLPNHQLIQTHISWVILGDDYVYKIKKPVKLSFLDFSTLEKRKYFCKQEVILNQRLTHDIYLNVQPITFFEGQYEIGSNRGEVIDYAVVMRRMDNANEMNKLLAENRVKQTDIQKIVDQLIEFHSQAEINKGKVNADALIDDFQDLSQILDFVDKNLGKAASNQLLDCLKFTDDFIRSNTALIAQRDKEGFTRDCHGDLHSGNIFLLEEPVLFDCIEFNPHFRQIDILNELAFFCMDLEFANRYDLSEYFIEAYNRKFEIIRNNEEELLFLFYKLYRANIKVKVNAIKTMQTNDPAERDARLALFKQYFQLFLKYYQALKEGFYH